ncbi:fluoride efflux transporter CrcB [Sphingosinicella sp.]|uniref:fluoride efflux transporter CrcB n=1 Tax=Sphingosinicella sp. TaxID=1917971 RepID=UPI00262CBFB6|nr:fluoride efflux transporter CrcB [Sphingosinicella sp.]
MTPPMIGHFFLVGAGGAVGAMLRHGVGLASLRLMGPSFPWGTLIVNVVGGLLMGLLVGLLAARGGSEPLRLLLGVGVLGGFTTFSAFSLDVVAMMERDAALTAIGYVTASVVVSVAALFIGKALV